MSGIGATCLMAALVASAVVPAPAPDWGALSDQQGRPVAGPGAPSIVVVVAARRARELRAWEQRLRKMEPRPSILRIVEVPADGRADEVARALRKRAPAGVSIAVDAHRMVARALDLDTRKPNVLVLDVQGRVARRIRGRADDRTAAAVGAAWAETVAAR